ncbi:methyl-accepting chemotaxis protein [Lachnospira multipara]|uniref:Methyl-accepting chemotaxis protein n=1 Tax=Lachnospira multipara TaxID=28051 RepID=A0A1H5X3E7_9FIRM|nr:cache domain-containing protein [Lachnospira multipara]SEG06302.1 Methyl-accepting chemotaxis protein [Lachnospira multipara]
MPSNNAKGESKCRMNMLMLLMLLVIIPTVCSALILNIMSCSIFSSKLRKQYEEQVEVIEEQFNTYVTELCENVGTSFFTKENRDYSYVDSFLSQNIALTVFIGDTRTLTSLKDSSGNRIEGTKASADVINTVLTNGKTYADDNTVINGEKYFVHYSPIKDSSGNIIGMTFAGKKASVLQTDINNAVLSLVLVTVIVLIIFTIIIYFMSKVIKKTLELIADNLHILASGDLDAEIEIPSAIKENKQMVSALTSVQKMLQNSIGKVTRVTKSLSKGIDSVEDSANSSANAANQIGTAMDELSSMAQGMAGNVQNVNTSVANMDVTVSDIGSNIEVLASNSDEMSTASAEAADCMEKVLSSNQVSSDAVESINRQILLTNESINKINEAITLIIGVASRTKLLSLNASIEAARAGEAGKGFAVVAQNISQLSEQSNESAATIREIAKEMLENSSESVKLAEDIINTMSDEKQSIADAQDRFTKLNDAINDSVLKIKEIDSKTVALNQIKDEIINDVNELSAISQQNAARNQEVNSNVANIVNSIEDIAKNMNKMKEMKDSLAEATSQFKIDK